MRRNICICLALLMVPGLFATTAANDVAAARFTFARPPAPESTVDPKGRLSAVIERWSTDAERDRTAATIADGGPATLLDAFRDVPRIGSIYWPGGLEYTVRYARRQARPDGGADVVLVTDRPLWMWWDSKAASTDYPFTVLHLRLGKDGTGEGRASMGVTVTGDTSAGVVLSDFAKAPAVLTDVRQERATS